MDVQAEIERYIGEQPAPKSEALRGLHRRILEISPGVRLWFLDGRNEAGKVVSNPNIGYGSATLGYADGGARDFYKLGLSATTSGLSLYVMGLKDRTWLVKTYGGRLGKAKITGYCISFRSPADLDLSVFEELVADALSGS